MKNDDSQEINNELFVEARDLFKNSNDFDKVKIGLFSKSDDAMQIEKVILLLKKEYYEIKRKEGLLKIGIGVLIILVGFTITFFNYHANVSFTFAMYGLTSIGIGLVLWGFYKIVG